MIIFLRFQNRRAEKVACCNDRTWLNKNELSGQSCYKGCVEYEVNERCGNSSWVFELASYSQTLKLVTRTYLEASPSSVPWPIVSGQLVPVPLSVKHLLLG